MTQRPGRHPVNSERNLTMEPMERTARTDATTSRSKALDAQASPRIDRVRGRRSLDKTIGAERMAKSFETILSKCGVMSPQRQRELDDVRARQLRQAAIAKAERFKAHCNVWPKYRHASLDDLDMPRELLTAEEF